MMTEHRPSGKGRLLVLAPSDGREVSDDGDCLVDPHLVAEGWMKRTTADANRCAEITELYESLGYEVRIEAPNLANVNSRCGDCGIELCQSALVIYTRRSDPN